MCVCVRVHACVCARVCMCLYVYLCDGNLLGNLKGAFHCNLTNNTHATSSASVPPPSIALFTPQISGVLFNCFSYTIAS